MLSRHEMARAVEVLVLRLIPIDKPIAAADLGDAVHALAEDISARCPDFDFFSWAGAGLGDLVQSLVKFRLVEVSPAGEMLSSSVATISRTDVTASYLAVAEQEAQRALASLQAPAAEHVAKRGTKKGRRAVSVY